MTISFYIGNFSCMMLDMSLHLSLPYNIGWPSVLPHDCSLIILLIVSLLNILVFK